MVMETKVESETGPFDPEAFVGRLLEEGSKCFCDETSESFAENGNLPSFYDEDLYKRGQKFFNHNIFVLLYCKFMGLLSILAIPTIVRILIYTKMSSTPLTAYRRYLATVFHMVIWYRSDFTPGSKLWRSLDVVKRKHNSASSRSFSAGLGRISQKDMALTQFGFMGFALAKREKVGLYDVDEEDLRGFVHLWRVIGRIMGVEDRFNICRNSVRETSDICNVLCEKVFRPAVNGNSRDFTEMARFLCEGMWAMNPTLNAKVYVNILHRLLNTSNNNLFEGKDFHLKLNLYEKFLFYLLTFTIWSLRFALVKMYHNHTQYLTLWLMKVFPFLAYYSHGYANSHLTVLQDGIKDS